MNQGLRNNRGFALVLTLVVTALIVAVAVEMIHQVYVDTSIGRRFRDGQQASLLAESGIFGGAKLLQTFQSGHPDYTSLSDEWAKPLKLEDEIGSIEISVAEESGRINLNGLVQPNGALEPFTLAALKRLGKRLKIPDDCWNSLADWIDKNDETRSGGAEDSYYLTMKPPYRAANRPLATLAELSLVKGFLPEYVAALRPFVTIHTGMAGAPLSQVNMNTAPKEVLTSLDDRIDDRMADRILEERRLQPFKSIAEVSRVSGFDTIAIGLGGKVSVKGTLFKVTSVARVKESARTVEAVVRITGAPEILSWQEY